MGSKWIRMVVLGIISHHRPMRWWQHQSHLPPLWYCSGITLSLASSHWVLSGTFPCFMGWVGIRGNALVGYTWVGRRDGSYVIDICVYCAGEEEKKWSHAFWFDCYCVDCVDWRDCRPVLLSTCDGVGVTEWNQIMIVLACDDVITFTCRFLCYNVFLQSTIARVWLNEL